MKMCYITFTYCVYKLPYCYVCILITTRYNTQQMCTLTYTLVINHRP